MKTKKYIYIYTWIVLDSKWSDECVYFTMMCAFYFFFCVCHHLLGQ